MSVAYPLRRVKAEDPVTAFPGKATWGYSSDVSGSISFGGVSKGSGRSFDEATGGAIRGGTTYGTAYGRWIGKATPIIQSSATKVVSSSVSVVGEEPDDRAYKPSETTTREPPPRPPPLFVPNDFRRRRIYPYFPPTHTYFPRMHPHFPNGGFYRKANPLQVVLRGPQGDVAYVHPQSRSLKASEFPSDENVDRLSYKKANGKPLGEELPLELGQKLHALGPADNKSATNKEQIMSQENSSVSQDLTVSSGRNLTLKEDLLNNVTASSVELFVSDKFTSTGEVVETDKEYSTERILSVHERNAENENIFLDQIASDTEDAQEVFGSYKNAASLKKTDASVASPQDQIVLASIFLKPATGGSVLPYYEEDDMSSYSSFQSVPPGNSINLFAAGYGSNSTRGQPIPRYIIVKDQTFSHVPVFGVDSEASASGTGSTPSRNGSTISKVLDTINATEETTKETGHKESESPSGCIQEDPTSQAVALTPTILLHSLLVVVYLRLF